jgi:hypothetical protein
MIHSRRGGVIDAILSKLLIRERVAVVRVFHPNGTRAAETRRTMVSRTIAIAGLIALTLGAAGAATTRQADACHHEAQAFRGGGFGLGAGFVAVVGLAAGAVAASAAYDLYTHPPGGADQAASSAEADRVDARVFAYGPLGS